LRAAAHCSAVADTLAGAAVSLADSVDSPAVPEMGGEPMIGP